MWLYKLPFLKLGIYFIYISNAIPKVPHTFPYPLPQPPTPTSWPCRSPVLRHIKFARLMDSLSTDGRLGHFLIHMQLETRALGGGGEYWLVHIVVPPIWLQIPLAPWVLSLAPPLVPCNPSNSWLWASTSVFARSWHSLTRDSYIRVLSAKSC